MWYIVSQLWQVSCCPFSGNISPSSLLPNNPTFIKCPEHTLGKALTLDVLCTSSGITAILNLFLLQKAMSFFSFFWDKVIKVLVLLRSSGGDCVGAFLLEPHLTGTKRYETSHTKDKSVTHVPINPDLDHGTIIRTGLTCKKIPL